MVFRAHLERLENFAVSGYFSVNICDFLSIRESLSRIKLAQIFMKRNQHVMDKVNVA
jgi:hypothetical protein